MNHTPRNALLAGKYELIAPAGEGGMATVWRGLTHGEAGFRRRVAIKRVLQQHAGDQEFAAMFVQEAAVVAELNHPNIVQVHDFGRDQWGNFFIIMEWVEGLGFDAYLRAFTSRGEHAPWHFVAAICIEALRALTAAHERIDELGRPAPVFHRDVNPVNILLSTHGVVKLADFGLARAMDRPGTTNPGIVKGKVAYMAPEILEGKRKADQRSDVYSIGVVLWEGLTGKRLFGGEGSDVEIALRALKAIVPRVNSLRDDVPDAIGDVAHCALARNPEGRFQSARAMVEALSSVLRRHPDPSDGNALARSIEIARKRIREDAIG